MKFAIKSLAVAAALVAAGSASAQTTVTASVGGAAQVVADPAGSGRTASFRLLGSYSGGNIDARSVSSGGDLSFSTGDYNATTNPDIFAIGGTLGALNVGNIAFTGVNGVTMTEQWRADNTNQTLYATKAEAEAVSLDTFETTRVGAVANSSINSVTAYINGPQAGQVLVASATGGAKQVGSRISGTLTGGTAIVENIRFDIAGGNVIADLKGTRNAFGTTPVTTYNSPSTVLWTFSTTTDLTGPTRLDPADLLSANPVAALTGKGYTLLNQDNSGAFPKYTVLASNVLSNLAITSAGSQFFINALGLQATGVNALNAVNTDPGKWGTAFSNLVFEVQEVPEPSTYALMGLGLVGISLVARRRAAK